MNIAVLCGGLSNERNVSISSGTGIAHALREKGHRVAVVDLFLGYTDPFDKPEDTFTTEDTVPQFLVAEQTPDLSELRAMRPDGVMVGPNVLEICKAADIAFLALHGEEGENGKLQALLDMYGIRYTGSGYLGSAIAMNKSISKTMLRAAGIPVPPGTTFKKGDVCDDVGFPCVVKPCSGGSSVGTTIVQDEEQYVVALDAAFRYEDSVIAERFIKGRELTVGVIDGKAMPVIEIIPKSGFYDYKNKYQPGLTEEICPAPISDEATCRVQDLAERVFHALKVDAYCRVDFIMEDDGDIYCLEANTLPGMTPTSLIPQMGAAMGMDYGTLCEKLIAASMDKYEKSDR